MKNNFLSKVTKMPQNTGGGNSQTKRATLALPLRYLCAMLLALVLGIGQMWGDTFSADEIAAKSGSVNVGTTKNHVTISLPGITATSNVKYAKISGTQLKRDMVEVSGKATGGSITTDKVLSIKVDRGYKLLSPIKINGSSSSTSDIKMAYVGWQGQPEVSFQLCNGATDWKFDKNSVTSEPTDREIAFATTIRTIYLYTQIKTANTDYNSFGTSKTVGSGTKAYVYTVDASATLAPEIEGESQMWNDETIALTGYPTGGTWAVVSGPGAIAADGKLTANGNGTIRVSYTVDAVSETKDIIAGTTKQYTWLFNTKDVMPTTLDVTPVKNDAATFESAGQIKLGTNGDYLYIDLSSKNLIVTAASINAKTGSENKHISFGSSKSATEDGNVSATNVYADVNITPTKPSMVFTVIKNAETSAYVASITLTVKKAVPHTLSYAISPDHDPAYATVTLGATSLIEGATTTATYSAIDAAYEFDEWQISGTGATLSGASGDHVTVTMGSTDATVTLKLKAAVTKYTITYSKGAYGTGDAIPDGKKDDDVDFTLSSSTYSRAGYVQTGWATEDGGAKAYELGGTYSTDADEDLFPFWTPVYTVTKGTHANGDFTISPASLVAGGTVTLDPTPADGYMFSAWEILKTSDASATGITVTNKQFEMPAYGVTINATFVADTRKKVLYLTTTNEANTKANDKLYAALKDDYNVTIAAPASQTLTDYDLIVLHESIGGTSSAAAVTGCKTTSVPVLNTKSYFYGADKDASKRWTWGAPNAGTSVNGATLNSAYCNIASHPLFNDVTVSEGFFAITTDAAEKCMQPVGSFATGYEGYTLATTPNAATPGGTGCAIHEIPAGTTARGATSGKYLMISVSNAKLNALNANGQKLFQNAAAYLVGSTAWTPISVPTSPGVTATPSENYTEGNTITLTASATGTTASTTYTWYKGDDWATASATTPVQAAATAASDGNVFTKTAVLGDAGTYWCNISNGTSCDVQASVTITVSSASTPTHAISYDNTKDADMSAYPTEYTEGVGIASFAALADITGWHFVEWSPASIAPDATTDQTITAVWAQVFEVTFDLRGHGASIDAQNIVDGGKVTKPDDPVAIGYDFGGWFTDEECTAGNEFDFNTSITAATPLYAKWTAFDGCTLLVPATSGDAPAVGDPISMQSGSKGGSMSVIGTPLSYNTYGLGFDSNSSAKAKVTINNEIQEGTVISLTLVANGTSAPRGLHLYTGDGATKIESLGWNSEVVKYTEATFTYTVKATDVALIGSNEFQLWRNGSVFLKKLTVTNCGDPIIFHNLTSAITPDNDPAYATVTLGASSVREGHTTTATYSAIDAAYEFDEWQISGTGASIADASANPAVITMGTADAVVTLKLKVATPKHTVTFNKMGKGADIASQLVAEGALVSEPSVTEPEGWLLEGWYKESTFENKWDFASDVMSTSDIELFANWVADTSIKLINKSTGAINTTNFTTAVAAEADVDGEKGAVFNANRDAISSVSALNEMVQYNVTTTQTKIQLVMYNTSSAEKTIHLFKVAEGDDAATLIDITIDGNSRKTTEYYTFNSDKNRSFYITVSDKKVQILQMRVVESGTALKQFGQAGYSLNLNKGRIFAKNDGSAYPFEGGSIKVSSDYKVLNNSNLATKSYIQFNNAVAGTILKVTRSGGNYYVSQDPEEKGTIYNANAEVELTATGTWYLGSQTSGSAASFTKIEFIAPKCKQPQFNALANSDICSGDPYVALNGTATVADAGVPTYKWYAEGADESDPAAVLATTATYTPSADGNYYVIATNHLAGYTDNTKKSDLVSVTTHSGTAITEPLVDLRGAKDAVVTLSVTASGKNLHYTWKESATIDGTYTDVAGATDAASLDVTITEGMDKYYKVIVHGDCGSDLESIAHVTQFVPVVQQNVTGSTVWDWAEAASVNEIKLTSSTTPKKNEGFVMANGAATVYNNANFESDKLYLEGEYIIRTEGGKLFQGQTIKFNTTVAGAVRVTFSHTGSNKPARELFINGVGTGTSVTGTSQTKTGLIEVPAGEVAITAFHVNPTDGAGQQYVRVYKIEFYVYDTERNDSWIAPGELGTICYPNGHIITGAEVYEMAGVDENNKFVFDQVEKTEPGKPYLFVATSYEPIKLYKTTAAAEVSPIANNGMIGTFVSIDLDYTDARATKWYYFSGKKFYSVSKRTSNLNVPANRAYVDMNTPVPAGAPKHGVRRITFDVQGANVATGVENAAATDKPAKMLINGQLFILRGEKMYDAKGQLVK